MAFILDHMTAVLVGGTLLAGLFLVQVRGQQSAIQAATRYRVQTQTASFAQTVERDVENIRTKAQAEAAFAHYRFTLRQATGADGDVYTAQATFVTLEDPALGAASPAMVVSYDVQPTGGTITVADVDRPTYTVRRMAFSAGGTLLQDGGATDVLDFDLTALMNDGSEIVHRGGSPHHSGSFYSEIPSLPRAMRVVIIGATDTVQRAEDQASTSQTNASRQTRTVSLVAYGSTGGLPPVAGGTPSPMPPLPGDPPPPPPPPPPTGTTSTGSSGGSTGSTSTGGTGGTGSTGGTITPPPRPTPGGGAEI